MHIGIDLGTTYCCISYKNSITNTLNVIDNPQKGGKSVPSVIAFNDDEIQYNLDAVNTKRNHPENVLYDSKRFIGRNFDNVYKHFDIEKLNFTLQNVNEKPNYCVKYKGKNLNLVPEQISALILRYLKRIAEKIVDKVEGCVITVPAHFNNVEREATLFAAEMAGLKVLQLLNEPSAAAISYGYEKGLQGYILVFDFGGGTLDVSVVSIENDKFDVVGYDGDQILGGRDIDNLLLEYCTESFKNTFNVEHDTLKKKAILLEKCELAKILLSEPNKTKTEIFDWNENNSIVLTKQKFEELCRPFFERSIQTM
jgi:molecular chaperone DnaK (HSP70)